ncbi:MAG: transposase [Desulfobacteraceae bacterium]|nr:transposase [Desulfobacteraceae bacterium]
MLAAIGASIVPDHLFPIIATQGQLFYRAFKPSLIWFSILIINQGNGRPAMMVTIQSFFYSSFENCSHCGFVANRDYNAALNILLLALIKAGLRTVRSVEMAYLPPSVKHETVSM